MLSRPQTGLAVTVEKLKEFIALYEIELAGLKGLSGQFIRLSGNCSVQSQYFPGLGNTKNKCLAFPRGCGQFYATAANDINTARRLAFYKQDGSGRKGIGKLDLVEIFYGLLWDITKKTGLAKLGDHAVFRNWETVGCAHA